MCGPENIFKHLISVSVVAVVVELATWPQFNTQFEFDTCIVMQGLVCVRIPSKCVLFLGSNQSSNCFCFIFIIFVLQ